MGQNSEDLKPPGLGRTLAPQVSTNKFPVTPAHQISPKNLVYMPPGSLKKRPARTPPTFCSSPRAAEFRKRYFSSSTLSKWNDWKWQLSHRIRTLFQLASLLDLTDQERRFLTGRGGNLPLGITPYYASLIDRSDPADPIRKSVVPVNQEMVLGPDESDDPLEEDNLSPVPGLVHRYPDRVLFLVTDFCSVYCRYCTRSRLVGSGGSFDFSTSQWETALQYIENTPVIRDVLISGGDPLTLSDARLDYLLGRLKRIRHVEFVRLGTKVPVVLPQRITPALVQVLKRYHPLWISLNFMHPWELTPEVSQACIRLADGGLPLGSQTVLLKGINDDVDTLKSLFLELLKIRVRPYYLYQCDPIHGSAHFRTTVEKGLEIIRGLRGFITGYAVPAYVIDAPGGGGKIQLLPEAIVSRSSEGLILQNYQGKLYFYPDPVEAGLP